MCALHCDHAQQVTDISYTLREDVIHGILHEAWQSNKEAAKQSGSVSSLLYGTGRE